VQPVACDHDAGDRAMLEAAGIPTEPARKEPIEEGLALVTRRLVARTLFLVLEDDHPPSDPITGRCDAHALAWELEGYRYPERHPDKTNVSAPRDLPLKKNDDAMDCCRYLIAQADGDALLVPDLTVPLAPGAVLPDRLPPGVGLAAPRQHGGGSFADLWSDER
jgi:hypothetical protein